MRNTANGIHGNNIHGTGVHVDTENKTSPSSAILSSRLSTLTKSHFELVTLLQDHLVTQAQRGVKLQELSNTKGTNGMHPYMCEVPSTIFPVATPTRPLPTAPSPPIEGTGVVTPPLTPSAKVPLKELKVRVSPTIPMGFKVSPPTPLASSDINAQPISLIVEKNTQSKKTKDMSSIALKDFHISLKDCSPLKKVGVVVSRCESMPPAMNLDNRLQCASVGVVSGNEDVYPEGLESSDVKSTKFESVEVKSTGFIGAEFKVLSTQEEMTIGDDEQSVRGMEEAGPSCHSTYETEALYCDSKPLPCFLPDPVSMVTCMDETAGDWTGVGSPPSHVVQTDSPSVPSSDVHEVSCRVVQIDPAHLKCQGQQLPEPTPTSSPHVAESSPPLPACPGECRLTNHMTDSEASMETETTEPVLSSPSTDHVIQQATRLHVVDQVTDDPACSMEVGGQGLHSAILEDDMTNHDASCSVPSQQPEDKSVQSMPGTGHVTGHDVTDHMNEDLVTDNVNKDDHGDLVTDHMNKTLVTDMNEDLVTDHVKEDLVTDHAKEDLLTDHAKEDLLTDHAKEDLLTDHAKEDLVTDHAKEDLLTDHVTDHVKEDLLTDHAKEDLVTDHAKEDHVTDHAKEDLVTDHAKEELVTDHAKEDLTDHAKEDLVTDHAKEDLVTDHAKEDLVTDHAKEDLLTDHVTDHVKEDLVTDHVKEDLVTDHTKEDLVTDHAKEDLVTDHAKEDLVTDHAKEDLVTDHVTGHAVVDTMEVEGSVNKSSSELRPQPEESPNVNSALSELIGVITELSSQHFLLQEVSSLESKTNPSDGLDNAIDGKMRADSGSKLTGIQDGIQCQGEFGSAVGTRPRVPRGKSSKASKRRPPSRVSARLRKMAACGDDRMRGPVNSVETETCKQDEVTKPHEVSLICKENIEEEASELKIPCLENKVPPQICRENNEEQVIKMSEPSLPPTCKQEENLSSKLQASPPDKMLPYVEGVCYSDDMETRLSDVVTRAPQHAPCPSSDPDVGTCAPQHAPCDPDVGTCAPQHAPCPSSDPDMGTCAPQHAPCDPDVGTRAPQHAPCDPDVGTRAPQHAPCPSSDPDVGTRAPQHAPCPSSDPDVGTCAPQHAPCPSSDPDVGTRAPQHAPCPSSDPDVGTRAPQHAPCPSSDPDVGTCAPQHAPCPSSDPDVGTCAPQPHHTIPMPENITCGRAGLATPTKSAALSPVAASPLSVLQSDLLLSFWSSCCSDALQGNDPRHDNLEAMGVTNVATPPEVVAPTTATTTRDERVNVGSHSPPMETVMKEEDCGSDPDSCPPPPPTTVMKDRGQGNDPREGQDDADTGSPSSDYPRESEDNDEDGDVSSLMNDDPRESEDSETGNPLGGGGDYNIPSPLGNDYPRESEDAESECGLSPSVNDYPRESEDCESESGDLLAPVIGDPEGGVCDLVSPVVSPPTEDKISKETTKDEISSSAEDEIPSPAKDRFSPPAKDVPDKDEFPSPVKDEISSLAKEKFSPPAKEKDAPAKGELSSPAKDPSSAKDEFSSSAEMPSPAKDEMPSSAKDEMPSSAKDEMPSSAKDEASSPASKSLEERHQGEGGKRSRFEVEGSDVCDADLKPEPVKRAKTLENEVVGVDGVNSYPSTGTAECAQDLKKKTKKPNRFAFDFFKEYPIRSRRSGSANQGGAETPPIIDTPPVVDNKPSSGRKSRGTGRISRKTCNASPPAQISQSGACSPVVEPEQESDVESADVPRVSTRGRRGRKRAGVVAGAGERVSKRCRVSLSGTDVIASPSPCGGSLDRDSSSATPPPTYYSVKSQGADSASLSRCCLKPDHPDYDVYVALEELEDEDRYVGKVGAA